MTISRLPLSYCTNVHPGRSLAEVLDGLEQFTLPIRKQFGQPLAAGLWLAAPVIGELQESAALARLKTWLREHDIVCYTLNAFPYGDFHSDRVKEQVYLPDWTTLARVDYTLACARVLATLLPDDVTVAGSISTVPLGFKPLSTAPDFLDRCLPSLLEVAEGLAALREQTGRIIRLAIEPEPFCVLETTPETVDFFGRLWERADQAGTSTVLAVREHIGVCYDVCHQAVEFEDVPASLRSLDRAGIRINKLHISCAIDVQQPLSDPAKLAALRRYIEPRYLHQTLGRTANGLVARYVDLDAAFLDQPPNDFRAADTWRVHFHVPVDVERLGPLGTTRSELEAALRVIPELTYAPHFEVETYTWEVLPDGGRPALVEGFARELIATQRMLSRLSE